MRLLESFLYGPVSKSELSLLKALPLLSGRSPHSAAGRCRG
jgi:hypothetical protein